MWGPWADVHVFNPQILQMAVKERLKLGAVVRLHGAHAKWEPSPDVVNEANRGALIARIKDLQDANPRAVIDRGELVEPFTRARETLQELHVHLHAQPGLGLLVALPAFLV